MARGSPANSSASSILKAYSTPIFIFFLAIFYQLVVIPRAYPPSHYDVLGLKMYSSLEEVKEAYNNIKSNWDSGLKVPSTIDFIKVQYAYELLSNPLWKRDYDIFNIDEQIHSRDNLLIQHVGDNVEHIKLPLLHAVANVYGDGDFNLVTSEDLQSMFNSSKPWLLQVYSSGSNSSAQFLNTWGTIAGLLNGIANTGLVELGDIQLATYLTERKPTGQVFFRNGLPSLVAFPPGCKSSDCLMRYVGELSIDAITDWFATTVLNLPRILYYTKETLVQNFIAKSGAHKVKVILFSKTGERATPFVRHAAKEFWPYASFASVLWKEEDASFWWSVFEVESAPAVVFMKDPGVKPVVYHGSVNESWFSDVLEQNKQLELPQLRSVSSMELGCDAQGYSRAGYDTTTWYCLILAGRQSMELNKMRETMRRVQAMLSDYSKSDGANKEPIETAAIALKNKRLSLVWLDGEAQQNYCSFYVHSETSHETCGPSRIPINVPRLLIVRYKRNVTEESDQFEKKPINIGKYKLQAPKSIWQSQLEEVDPASQLVVSYKGSADTQEIIQWISKMVEDGDSANLPFYRAKTPKLVPEDTESTWWSRPKSTEIKQKTTGIMFRVYDFFGDPRLGPTLFLAALISASVIWWMRSQPTYPPQSSQPNERDPKDETAPKKREPARNVSDRDRSASITDFDPKDAYQVPLSDSDSE